MRILYSLRLTALEAPLSAACLTALIEKVEWLLLQRMYGILQ